MTARSGEERRSQPPNDGERHAAPHVGEEHPKSSPLDGHPRLSTDGYEMSQLLVELMQVANDSRRSAARGPSLHPVRGGGPTPIHELSPHAVRGVMYIHQRGTPTVGELAAGLRISYGWASRVVDELEQIGYVVRERDPDDRRVVRVRLDDAARQSVERAHYWRGEVMERAVRQLSPAERDVVRRFLRQVVDELQEGPPEARVAASAE